MKLSYKLGALCAAASLGPLLVAFVFVGWLHTTNERKRDTDKADAFRRIISSVYEKRLAELRYAAERLSSEIAATITSTEGGRVDTPAWARLQDLMPRTQNEFGLDFIVVADPSGKVVGRHNGSPAADETLLAADDRNPLVEQVVSSSPRQPGAVAQAVVERPQQLERLGLAILARVERGVGGPSEDGLVIEAAAPVRIGGRPVAVVLIGQMLNNYNVARPGATGLHTPFSVEVSQALFEEPVDGGAVIALGDTVVASTLGTVGGRPCLLGAGRGLQSPLESFDLGGCFYRVTWVPLQSRGVEVGAVGAAESVAASGAGMGGYMVLAGLFAVALSGIGGYLLGRSLGRRAEALGETAFKMGVGELNEEVRDPGRAYSGVIRQLLADDEISRLAEQLDRARENIRQGLERLRKR